ncbi:hypothetical protein ACFQZ0_01275 [Streptomyces erythrogriseus]
MVAEIRPNYPTEWAAMKAVAAKLGIGAAETVRTWVRKTEVDVVPHPPPQIRPSEPARHPGEHRLQLRSPATEFSYALHTRSTTIASSGHDPLLEY